MVDKVYPCVGGSEQEHLLGEIYKLMLGNGETSGTGLLLPVSRFSVKAARHGMKKSPVEAGNQPMMVKEMEG